MSLQKMNHRSNHVVLLSRELLHRRGSRLCCQISSFHTLFLLCAFLPRQRVEEGNTVDSDNPLFPLTLANWLVSVHSSLGSGEGGITKETNYESSYNTFQELQNRLEDFKTPFLCFSVFG